jgi:glucose-6-phosphate isomerase
MASSKSSLWNRYQEFYTEYPAIGLGLDISRVNFPDDFLAKMERPIQRAFIAMAALEKGDISNPDEKRMVGHYWLRNPALAPTPTIGSEIVSTLAEIKAFAADVHSGKLRGAGGPFKNVLVVGIGGSALGPQFVAKALGQPASDKLHPYFFDNTDPDGMDKVLAEIGAGLGQTVTVVISKSGGTPETRNGMLEAAAAYSRAGLDFGRHAVAVTQYGSVMDKHAVANHWLRRFPMWDWVGGRTSETSAVGLLPAALQGLDIDGFLAGAKACDDVTRSTISKANPAALLALMWYYLEEGRGAKDMVVLPYKDRLDLFSKYLQQLLMESLGKELDLDGRIVNQGISVYGNKGSTDQHAYVQQLREGVANFFVVFVEVLKERAGSGIEVEPGVTSGDYLSGLMLGTREALYEKGRQSITLTVPEVSPFTVGVLIALFERAVGFYASLVNINAYHQPGVEAGKKAAATVLGVQAKLVGYLSARKDTAFSADQIAEGIGQPDAAEAIFKIASHLAANGRSVKASSWAGTKSAFQAL